MPELPEMENYRRLLSDKIGGKQIARVEITRARTVNMGPEVFMAGVQGTTVSKLSRKGKNLFFHLSNAKVLHLHLMLGGWMYYSRPEQAPPRTKQVIFSFDDGTALFFINLRLGFLHLLQEEEWQAVLAALGPDVMSGEFSEAYWQQLLRGRSGYLKPLLVKQELLAGIGSAYADEICFTAGVRPDCQTDSLNPEQDAALYRQIPLVLQRALRLGGYMEHPLFPGDTLTGGYNEHFYVYDRANQACRQCGGSIEQGQVSGRKFFYCPNCQPQGEP